MAKKTKNISLSAVPQTREDVVKQIARIGDIQGQLAIVKVQHDERIREIGKSFDEIAAPLDEELASLTVGVQTYCEAHRSLLLQQELCRGGQDRQALASENQKQSSRRARLMGSINIFASEKR